MTKVEKTNTRFGPTSSRPGVMSGYRWCVWLILIVLFAGLLSWIVPGRMESRASLAAAPGKAAEKRLLYVASPGIRNYLEYGGHGILVYDIDDGHRFVKRIPTAGLNQAGQPLNVKGVCASALTKRIYVSTLRTLTCLDLVTEKILWEKAYPGGCDRMAISP